MLSVDCSAGIPCQLTRITFEDALGTEAFPAAPVVFDGAVHRYERSMELDICLVGVDQMVWGYEAAGSDEFRPTTAEFRGGRYLVTALDSAHGETRTPVERVTGHASGCAPSTWTAAAAYSGQYTR